MALLPKISNALAKFVTPVTQSSAQTRTALDSPLSQAQKQAAEKGAKKKDSRKKADLRLVPPVSREPDDSDLQNAQEEQSANSSGFRRFQPTKLEKSEEEHSIPPLTEDPTPVEGKSVAAKIVDIFRLFQDGQKNLNQSAGTQVYKEMTKDEQKGKFRRGAMLDEKIE